MWDVRVGKAANRSVVGIMNEFSYLADAYRQRQSDLMDLARELAGTPCGPPHRTHVSPDRALQALVATA